MILQVAGYGRRHGLVEQSEPLGRVVPREEETSQRRECENLEVASAAPPRDGKRFLIDLVRFLEVVRALCALEKQGDPFGAGTSVGQESFGAPEPSVRDRMIPVCRSLLRRNPERHRCRTDVVRFARCPMSWSALWNTPKAAPWTSYRELGDLFSVPLAAHNRWAGFKALRDAHDRDLPF